MISILIIFLFLVTYKFYFGLDLLYYKLDLKKGIIVDSEGLIDPLKTKLNLRWIIYGIDKRYNTDKPSRLKKLFHRAHLFFIKNKLEKSRIFHKHLHASFNLVRILIGCYILAIWYLKPSLGDIDGITEKNGQYYFYERECEPDGIGGTDCTNYIILGPLTESDISRYYEIKANRYAFDRKYLFFLYPSFNLGVFEVFYSFFILFVIFSPSWWLSKLFVTNQTVFLETGLRIREDGVLVPVLFSDQFPNSPHFNILLLRYIFGHLSAEENFYFDSFLQYLSWGKIAQRNGDFWSSDEDERIILDKYNYRDYIERNNVKLHSIFRFLTNW